MKHQWINESMNHQSIMNRHNPSVIDQSIKQSINHFVPDWGVPANPLACSLVCLRGCSLPCLLARLPASPACLWFCMCKTWSLLSHLRPPLYGPRISQSRLFIFLFVECVVFCFQRLNFYSCLMVLLVCWCLGTFWCSFRCPFCLWMLGWGNSMIKYNFLGPWAPWKGYLNRLFE